MTEFTPKNVAKLEAEIAEKIMGMQVRSIREANGGWHYTAIKDGHLGHGKHYISDSNAWYTMVDMLAREHSLYIEEGAGFNGDRCSVRIKFYNNFHGPEPTDYDIEIFRDIKKREEARFHAMTEALPKITEIIEGD